MSQPALYGKRTGWTEITKYVRHPYRVSKSIDGTWAVDWHWKTAGVSSTITHGLATPEDAMKAAEAHGEANGWRPKA